MTSRTFVAALTAGAGSLVLLAAPGDAQTGPKETTMTTSVTQRDTGKTATDGIRPFHVNIPEAALVDLRRRIAATRWPDKETVADQSQGVQLATVQKLIKENTDGRSLGFFGEPGVNVLRLNLALDKLGGK